MLAMFVVLFFLASIKMRILLASLSVFAMVVTLAFLPASLRSRLASATRIVSSSDASPQTGEDRHLAADDSAVARQTLFMTSVNLTLENPVFGVGPGHFASTIVEYGKSQGLEWAPLNTHNSYTQISSETGIPGFLLFGLLIFFSLRSAVSTLRRTSPKGANPDPEIHRMAAGLLVSLAAMLTCMFFLSEGYNLVVFLWLGLACGLRLLLPDPPPDEEEELIEMEPGQLASEP
jgi:O-antigen ligase